MIGKSALKRRSQRGRSILLYFYENLVGPFLISNFLHQTSNFLLLTSNFLLLTSHFDVCMLVRMCPCLSVCPSVYMSVRLSVCLCVCIQEVCESPESVADQCIGLAIGCKNRVKRDKHLHPGSHQKVSKADALVW